MVIADDGGNNGARAHISGILQQQQQTAGHNHDAVRAAAQAVLKLWCRDTFSHDMATAVYEAWRQPAAQAVFGESISCHTGYSRCLKESYGGIMEDAM